MQLRFGQPKFGNCIFCVLKFLTSKNPESTRYTHSIILGGLFPFTREIRAGLPSNYKRNINFETQMAPHA